jgi:hypothetical protein
LEKEDEEEKEEVEGRVAPETKTENFQATCSHKG